MRNLLRQSMLVGMLVGAVALTPVAGQGGRGGRGMMGDAGHAADMQLFHQLFAHRTEIQRRIIARDDGVETITESANPEVTRVLQTHVESMLARVKEGRPLHQRDPLFVELFRYAGQIEATHELTPGGVRVVETSRDAYVAKLIQAHAQVVSAFIANGMPEMMVNHPLPQRP